jgi:hypothetical protein
MKTYGIVIPKGSKQYQESEKILMESIVSRPMLTDDTVIKKRKKLVESVAISGL